MRAYYFLALLLLGCGPGGGGGAEQGSGQPVEPKKDPAVTLSADVSEITLGESVLLSWQSRDVDRCLAANAWGGEKALSGTETNTPNTVGQAVFVLTCISDNLADTAESVSVTDQVTITVLPNDPAPITKSGRDSEDARALFEHYHQYTQ